ncbi:MAG: DUF2384 domain-containing protein [Candidatus Cloacimonetes bacterium]|nr:DUF2384 domain-containing protein [Candidatus Cloacimonadota bacterium]
MLRHQRFCLRTGKDICWECCNNLRYDYKCPAECRYCLKEETSLSANLTKVDSEREYRDLVKRLMDQWLLMPQSELGNEIPREMAKSEAGRQLLENYFNRNNLSSILGIDYLIEKLNLTKVKLLRKSDSYEDVAQKYLKHLLAQDYEGSISYLRNSKDLLDNTDWKTDYLSQLTKDKVISKMKEYHLVSSAISEDREQAVVYFDINGKYDMTLKLKLTEKEWHVWQRIMGKMEIVNGENEAAKQIAVLLSKSLWGQASELLGKYMALYPESADFHYYQGIYELVHQKTAAAKQNISRAIRLDPEFKEAIFNYGYLIHQEGDLESALKYYQRAEKLDDSDIRVKNNIAAILIDKNEFEAAEKYIRKCLDIDETYQPAQQNLERLKEIKK